MPNYLKKKIQEYSHIIPTCLHGCPCHHISKKIGAEAKASLHPDPTSPLDSASIKSVQQIVGSIYPMLGPLT